MKTLLVCVLFVCVVGALGQDQNPASAPPAQVAPAAGVTPASNLAMLHVYRHRKYVGSALAPTVSIDGKPVARIGNGRRATIKLSVGSHNVGSDNKSSLITIDAKAGQDYYIRIEEETGFWKGHGKLSLLMPEQGGPEYKLQKPIEPDRIVDKDMVAEDTEPSTPDKNDKN